MPEDMNAYNWIHMKNMCFYCRSLMHGHGVCPPVQNFDSEDDNSGKSDISSASEDKESNETLLNKTLFIISFLMIISAKPFQWMSEWRFWQVWFKYWWDDGQ